MGKIILALIVMIISSILATYFCYSKRKSKILFELSVASFVFAAIFFIGYIFINSNGG